MIMGAWGMGRKRLPYDAEVEYLESTGAQWIDTGIKCSQVYSVTARYMALSWAAYGKIFNSYIDEQHNALRVIFEGALSNFGYTSLNSKAHGSIRISFYADRWYDYSAKIESGLLKCKVNSYEYSQEYITGTVNDSQVVLFGDISSRVANFALYDQNGNALCDYQPVRITNEQGVSEGAMYDRVSGQLFRNRGTGAFLWAEKQ